MSQTSKVGYSTTTYCKKLLVRHLDWIVETKVLYNQVVAFYHNVLLERQEWLSLSNQNLLRQLEILTIGEKRKGIMEAECPIPYKKVPLYFRRAAINTAISLVRSYAAKYQTWKEKKEVYLNFSKGKKSGNFYLPEPKPASQFHSSPVYYKGMYKEMTETSILLKVYTGTSWAWVKQSIRETGRKIPQDGICQSPTLKINRKSVMLHIPVVTPVSDVRTVIERMEDRENLCAVSFPNNDNLAVCAMFHSDGTKGNSFFIKGGDCLKARRKYYMGKIRRDAQLSNGVNKGESKRQKIRQLTEFYAHLVSRRIIDYCIEKQIKVIVVPDYGQGLALNTMGYMKATEFDWIGRRIINYTQYKAFQAGIVVTGVKPYYSSSKCHQCGEVIKKYNEGHRPNVNYYGGKLFVCSNGHRGNTALNGAYNIGTKFLERFPCAKISLEMK